MSTIPFKRKHETCPSSAVGRRTRDNTLPYTDWMVEQLGGNPFLQSKRYRKHPGDVAADLADEFYRRFRTDAHQAYARYQRGEVVTLVAQG